MVGRRDREVALLGPDLVPEVRALLAPRIPVALDRVHLIEGVALVLGVAHVVEDEELGLGPEVAGVGQPRRPEVGLGLGGHVAGVAGIRLPRHGVAHVAVDVQGAVLAERVDHRRVGVGHEQHVGLLDLLESPDRRPVEPEALFEDVLGQLVGGHRKVLHEPGQVDEPDIDDLDALVLHQAEHFRRGPLLHRSSLVWPIVDSVGPISGALCSRCFPASYCGRALVSGTMVVAGPPTHKSDRAARPHRAGPAAAQPSTVGFGCHRPTVNGV